MGSLQVMFVRFHEKSTGYSATFFAKLAVGQQAYVMARCPSCVRPCIRQAVRALTFSVNIFISETTYRILMTFHRNVSAMVLFRISWKNLILSKILVAMEKKKIEIFENLLVRNHKA